MEIRYDISREFQIIDSFESNKIIILMCNKKSENQNHVIIIDKLNYSIKKVAVYFDFALYKVLDVKSGGQGEVFLCFMVANDVIKSPVAIKTFHQNLEYAEANASIEEEAKTWYKLGSHTNIVKLIAFQRYSGRPHLVLEYILGESLQYTLENREISLRSGLLFAIQFCNGMEYACSIFPDFTHGDIKPSNIMLSEDGNLKITDFGSAALKADIRALNKPVTFLYISPESFCNPPRSIAADIYSFGIVLYQIFSRNSFPYKLPQIKNMEDLFIEYKKMHLNEEIIPIDKFNDGLPNELSALILKCLDKHVKNRFSGFGEMKKELMQIYKKLYRIEPELSLSQTVYKDYEEQLNKCPSLLFFKEYDEVIKICENALKEIPNTVKDASIAYAYMGTAYYCKNNYDEAFKHCDLALVIDSNSQEALTTKALTCTRLRKFREAAQCYQYIIDNGLTVSAVIYSNIGQVYLDEGKYKIAVSFLRKAMKTDPTHFNAWLNMGLVLLRDNKPKCSILFFEKALKIDPLSEAAIYSLGFSYVKLNNAEKALNLFKKVLEMNARSIDAYLGIGLCSEILGNLQKAEECYDMALKIDEKNMQALILKINIVKLSKNIEKTREIFEKIKTFYPDDHHFLAEYALDAIMESSYIKAQIYVERIFKLDLRARMHYDLKFICQLLFVSKDELIPFLKEISENEKLWNDLFKAIDEIDWKSALFIVKKILNLTPESAQAWARNSLIYHNLHDIDAAKDTCAKALSLCGNLYIGLYMQAGLLSYFKKFNDSKDCYQKLLEIESENFRVLCDYSSLLIDMNDPEEARKAADKSIKLFPYNGMTWYNYGTSLLMVGNSEEALKALNKSITLNPNIDKAWSQLGVLHAMSCNIEEAISSFDKSLVINPNLIESLINKANIFIKIGNYDDAIKYYNKVLLLSPDCPPAHYYKALVLHKTGRFQESIEYYESAYKLDPINVQILFDKFDVLINVRNYNEAKQCYDILYSIDPDNSDLVEMKNKIISLGEY